ncbi:ABC transporter ATP-binding protein [Actinoplanes palleronii]|uniref:Multidrug ABC transporter permease n=1 Tax=Actinoplanes palleronii TaxID=113570 RepID=A0ABQ4BAB4_9ACTN|nr:ABC transporter ATP-binding protein [Actinoplanes palleronii]GIE67577.1 multidrug ABC transporter permease [Actinoplanes palleronii]
MNSRLKQTTVVRQAVARLEIARLTGLAGAPLIALAVLVNLVIGLLPIAYVVSSSLVLGKVPAATSAGLDSPAYRTLIMAFLITTVVSITEMLVAPLQELAGQLIARRVDGRVSDALMAAATATPGIGPLEDPRLVEDLRTAARELETWAFSPGEACAGLFALLARYTKLAGYAVLVGVVLSWWASAGLVVAVLLLRYGQRGGLRKFAQVRFDLDDEERRNDYLRDLATDAVAAKEMRVFGLLDHFRDRWHREYMEWLKPVWAARRRIYLWPFLWILAWGLAVSGVVFALTGVAAADPAGGFTLTTFVMVMQAAIFALRLGEFYPEADLHTAIGMHAHEAVRRFVDGIRSYGSEAPPGAAPARPAPVSTIHFDRVSFHYPGEQRMIFEELDLTIAIGRCTALVGMNGAGKTTLVKLLARLYEPTAGTIRVDGVDIRSMPLAQWRARLGVTFQEFARYEVSVADNVGFGAAGHLEDRDGIRAAIDSVGLRELIDALPEGMDTPLARHLAGGADLSGGQWQRIALARALFGLRHGASILVLDEPTASLDVRAEAGFFQQFTSLTEGATTLLISHRFSTVRQADQIVVLADGRVAEQGSHDELMTEDGVYAHLFRLQADRFADERRTDAETVRTPA